MCGSGAWAAANRIGAALRAALCGAPATTSLSASDAAKQELVAVSVLGTATDMAIVASNEWSQLSTQGGIPHHVPGMALLWEQPMQCMETNSYVS
jgi:hypothetical protein